MPVICRVYSTPVIAVLYGSRTVGFVSPGRMKTVDARFVPVVVKKGCTMLLLRLAASVSEILTDSSLGVQDPAFAGT